VDGAPKLPDFGTVFPTNIGKQNFSKKGVTALPAFQEFNEIIKSKKEVIQPR
jgi:hypothetical protein